VAHAPEALSHQGRRSEVRWHWMRDYTHRFSYREKMMRCTADAALLLRVRSATENGTSVQDKWYSLFVLLDSEIAGDTWLEQRTGRLLCYRESAECWSVYQHFPMVLVLVSTPHRMEHWQWCAMGAATALHVVPLLGALACLPEKQSLGSFNPWRLAWKALGKGGHAHSDMCCIHCQLKQYHQSYGTSIQLISSDKSKHLQLILLLQSPLHQDEIVQGSLAGTIWNARKLSKLTISLTPQMNGRTWQC
jgi:hypothetical protein